MNKGVDEFKELEELGNFDEWENMLIDNSLKEIDPDEIGQSLTFEEYETNVASYVEDSIKDLPNTDETTRLQLGTIIPTKGSFLEKLAKVESGHKGYSTPPNKHGYESKYQHRFRKGDDGRKYMSMLGFTNKEIDNVNIRRNPAIQEAVMAKAVEQYTKDLKRNGVPVNHKTLWYRHNQGMGGTNAIMKGKLSSIIRRNIKNQFGTKESASLSWSSDADYISNYKKKFDSKF